MRDEWTGRFPHFDEAPLYSWLLATLLICHRRHRWRTLIWNWRENGRGARDRGDEGELSCSIGMRFCQPDTWAVRWNKNQLINFNIIVFMVFCKKRDGAWPRGGIRDATQALQYVEMCSTCALCILCALYTVSIYKTWGSHSVFFFQISDLRTLKTSGWLNSLIWHTLHMLPFLTVRACVCIICLRTVTVFSFCRNIIHLQNYIRNFFHVIFHFISVSSQNFT